MVVHWQVLRKISTKIFLDRKSTRLNSSHLGISYAVFCLKKKNNLGAQGRHTTKGIDRQVFRLVIGATLGHQHVDRHRGEIQALELFFFNDTATTEIYTLSLHDALPI